MAREWSALDAFSDPGFNRTNDGADRRRCGFIEDNFP
jgi:hypothetical protein